METQESKRGKKRFVLKRPQQTVYVKMIAATLLCSVLALSLVSCKDRPNTAPTVSNPSDTDNTSISAQSEEESVPSLFMDYGIITDTPHKSFRTYPTVTDFLKEFGLEGAAPFYTFDHSNLPDYDSSKGTQKMELYYSENTQKGCVILYCARNTYACAFDEVDSQPGTSEPPFFNPFADPFDIGSSGDEISTGMEFISGESETTKNGEGKPTRYTSMATFSQQSGTENIEMYSYNFYYREDGTLEKKSYVHNTLFFPTTHSSRVGYYDSAQRLVYEHSYITHGSLEYYTIYSGGSKTPSYQLVLDDNIGIFFPELTKFE